MMARRPAPEIDVAKIDKKFDILKKNLSIRLKFVILQPN